MQPYSLVLEQQNSTVLTVASEDGWCLPLLNNVPVLGLGPGSFGDSLFQELEELLQEKPCAIAPFVLYKPHVIESDGNRVLREVSLLVALSDITLFRHVSRPAYGKCARY